MFVAACGSGAGKPTRLPDRSPTPSVTASLTPEQQVEAAVRAYYAEVNRALSSGQTTQLAMLSHPQCSCRRLVTYISEKWEGGALRGARYELKLVKAHPPLGGVLSALVSYSVSAYDVLDRSGRVIEQVEGVEFSQKDVSLQRNAAGNLVFTRVVNLQ